MGGLERVSTFTRRGAMQWASGEGCVISSSNVVLINISLPNAVFGQKEGKKKIKGRSKQSFMLPMN